MQGKELIAINRKWEEISQQRCDFQDREGCQKCGLSNGCRCWWQAYKQMRDT